MLRTMMKSKIRRATVTEADPEYVGSVTVDSVLEAADLLADELDHIVDVTNGARLETYPIAGERGSGVLGISGAAAHLATRLLPSVPGGALMVSSRVVPSSTGR